MGKPVHKAADETPDAALCNLPAPGNFHVSSYTSSSVTIAWDPVAGASAYYIAALGGNGQLVVDDDIVTATSGTLYPQPGSTIDLRVYAICPNQVNSTHYSEILNFTIILTDLIVENSAPCADPPASVGPITSGSVFANWVDGYVYWFDILDTENNRISRYEATVDDANDRLIVRKVPEQYYARPWYSVPRASLLGNSGFSSPPVFGFYTLEIGRNTSYGVEGVYWVNFTFYDNYCSGQPCFEIHFTQLNTGYQAYFRGGAQCGGTDRNLPQTKSKHPEPATWIVASPFSDHLVLRNVQPQTEAVHISLFDANGRLALDQTLPAVQEYNLPTVSLSPGLYWLRMVSGNAVQTFKVVKSH